MKKTLFLLLLNSVLALFTSTEVSAEIIEQGADGYTIHVDEIPNLTGKESLLDILLMCPNVMSLDNATAVDDITFDNYEIHQNDLLLLTDPELFLSNTRAEEVAYIEITTHPAASKGNDAYTKVIDVYYRDYKEGTSGSIAVKADSYGSLTTFNSVKYKKDNMLVWGNLEGSLKHSKDYIKETHSHDEAATAGMSWDINEKDNLLLQLTQRYGKQTVRDDGFYSYDRYLNLDAIYTRKLNDRGAEFKFQGALFYNTMLSRIDYFDVTSTSTRYRNFAPSICGEYFIPFSDRFSLMAGVEMGALQETPEGADYKDWFYYCDFYSQLTFNVKGINFAIGDRLRSYNYMQNDIEEYWDDAHTQRKSYNHSQWENIYNASIYGNIGKYGVLKGSFERNIITPVFASFLTVSSSSMSDVSHVAYLKEVKPHELYLSELKYTHQKGGFTLEALVSNAHYNNRVEASNINHDNLLQTGITSTLGLGIMRLTAAANYYHYKVSTSEDGDFFHNFVRLRLQPALNLASGWRIVPTIIYSSKIDFSDDEHLYIDVPANLSATLLVSKRVGRWNFDLRGNNLIDQHFGKRSVSLGATYCW